MLLAIDQWAFKVLLSMYSFLGVTDIPREPSPDWQVVEKWAEQPDQTFRLVIESTTISEKCKENPQKYVVFPQTYMGHQEVLVDGQLVYTNAMSEFWNLGTLYNQASVSCSILRSSKKVTFLSQSYQAFFNGISFYPEIKSDVRWRSFFYNSIYLVAATVCLCLGLIGSILMRKLNLSEGRIMFLGKDLVSALLMFCYVPGYWFDCDVSVFQMLSGLSLTTIFLLIVIPVIFSNSKYKTLGAGIYFLNLILWLILYRYKNIAQLFFISYSIPFVALFFLVNIVIFFRRKKDFSNIERLTFVAILLLTIQDICTAYVYRNNYFHLAILATVFSVLNFFKAMGAVQDKKIEADIFKEKLKHEINLVEKLSIFHEFYREIIHDLRAPISALNFINSSNLKNIDSISLISKRFVEILDRIERKEIQSSADWYSIQLVEDSLSDIFKEKVGVSILSVFDNSHVGTLVFFDPIDLKIIVSELIDNSRKEKPMFLQIKVNCSIDDDGYFCIQVLDNGPGAKMGSLEKMGQKGYTDKGTGLGLFSVNKRMVSLGGEFSFRNTEYGFSCLLRFRSRK